MIRLKDKLKLLEAAANPVSVQGAIKLLDTSFCFLPSVHFIAAVTKHGKTNFAANLTCSTLAQQDKKVFVAMNEETAPDFLSRCACIFTGFSFTSWKNGQCSSEQKRTLVAKMTDIVKHIDFVDDEIMNMGCIEDVVSAVKAASQNEQTALVIFDYLQNVYLSKDFPGKTQYELSKLLGTRFKDIGKTTQCPIVVFGQLKDATDMGFKSRVEGDSWFVNNVASGLELVADKLAKQSRIIIHTDRFQNRQHDEFHFKHSPSGRLVSIAKPEGVDDEA